MADTRLLTLSFDKRLEDVILQYHPYQLSMSERSQSSTVAGLDNLVTYVAPQNTTDNSIRINAYLTSLIPDTDNILNQAAFSETLAFGLGAGASAAAVAASFGGRTALDILDAATAVISLGKGVYDIGTGIISPNVITPSPIGLPDEQFKKLVVLSDAINQTIPCTVFWDIALDAFPLNKYIITNMELDVKHLQDNSGKTMILDLQLTLSKQGTRIEVI